MASHISASNSAESASKPDLSQHHRDQQQAEQQTPLMTDKPETHAPPAQQELPHGSSTMTWPQTLTVWLPEMAAGVLMLVCVGAIVATLQPYAGKPEPDWPFSISINTLLAIYSFVLKGCLALILAACISQQQWLWYATGERSLEDVVTIADTCDNPLGAARWLWRHRLRGPWMAFAALLVILSMAIDPFIQQLILFTSCTTVLADGNATLPRTNYFPGTGLHLSAGQVLIAPGLQVAFNAGLYNRNSQPDFNCTTGNCTFGETYSSISYCAACADISDTLTFNTTCIGPNCTDPLDWQLNSTLPSGLSVLWPSGYAEGDRNVLAASSPSLGTVQVLQGQSYYSSLHIDPVSGEPIADCEDAASNDTWRCRGYGAAQCTLSPCVQTYRADISQGVLTETVVPDPAGAPPLTSWGINTSSWTMAMIDTRCLTGEEMDHLAAAGYANISAINASSQPWLPYHDIVPDAVVRPENDNGVGETSPENAFLSAILARQCLYVFEYMTQRSLWLAFLDDFFAGNVTAVLNANTEYVSTATGPQQLTTLYNYGSVTVDSLTSAFQGMADAVSVYLRENGHVNQSSPARGTVHHYATCLEVHWPWIALPAVLIAADLVLLAGTIMAARQGRVPLWKGSPLALVFHGPVGAAAAAAAAGSGGAAAGAGAKALQSADGMEKAARKILVRLDRETDATGDDLSLQIQPVAKPNEKKSN